MSSSSSSAPLISRLPRELGLMPTHSVVGLAYRIVVAKCKSTILDWCRVVDFAADRYL